jgi:hypothetical protein
VKEEIVRIFNYSALLGAVSAALAIGIAAVLLPSTPLGAQQPTQMDAGMESLRREAHAAHEAAMKAQVLAVIYQIDTVGLHDLDESVEAGTIPSGSLGRVRRSRIAVEAVAWPEGLRETANKLKEHLNQLESAVRDENVDAAKDPAHEAHDVGHDLSDLAYGWLGTGQVGDGHGMGEGH